MGAPHRTRSSGPRLLTAAVLAVAAITSLSACGTDAKASGAGAGSGAPASMHDWYTKGGNVHMTAVSRSVTSVSDDAKAGDVPSMGNDCVTLLTDIQNAQIYPGAPDIVTQGHWSQALDGLAQSAADCRDGATNSDKDLIAKSDRERTAGVAQLRLAMSHAADLADG